MHHYDRNFNFLYCIQSFRRSIRQNVLANNEQKDTLTETDNDDIKKVGTNTAPKEVIAEKDQFTSEKVTEAKAPGSDITSDSASLDESEKLKFRGFRNNILGTIGYLSCIIVTILFLTFLGCIVGDYCKFILRRINLIPSVWPPKQT
jgi:hypothetical protein